MRITKQVESDIELFLDSFDACLEFTNQIKIFKYGTTWKVLDYQFTLIKEFDTLKKALNYINKLNN